MTTEKIPRQLVDSLASLTQYSTEYALVMKSAAVVMAQHGKESALLLKSAAMQMDERAQMGGAAAVAACGIAAVLWCSAPGAQDIDEQKSDGGADPVARSDQSGPPPVTPAVPPVHVLQKGEAAEGAQGVQALEPPSPAASTAWRQLGEELLSSQGASTSRTPVPTTHALADKKLVAAFFSARWSAPCSDFTPRLAQWYAEAAAKHSVEVVYISCDVDEDGFAAHFDKMPWLALPFADRERATQLRTSLGVTSIPSVVLLGSHGVPQSSDAALRALPGLPQVVADTDDAVTTSHSPVRPRGLAGLRPAVVQEYCLDGTTRGGKRIAGWHSREKPDEASRALRCYLDGAVVRASEFGPWLQLEHDQGFLRRELWGAGWRATAA
jgi:nucleoredoxin